MKRKGIINIIVVIMTIAVICVSVSIVKYRKDKKAAEEAYAAIKNDCYTYRLHIKGKFSYEGNKIYVENIEYDYNQLMVDVAFFNYKHENEQITVEQLYEEYEVFLNGEGVDILDKFVNCDDFDMGCDYSDYCDSIDDELGLIREEKQRNGEDVPTKVYIQSATIEEIQEAINRVNQRGDSE